MISGNANPDIDPANNDTLAGTLRFTMYKYLQNINGMLPAKVIKYDRDTNRVQVQLLIAMVTTEGAQVSRSQIASLPVLVLGGGNSFISFPINPDDLGWVIASDRDISLFLQTYQETAPNTARIHNFADGLFVPDIMRNFTINSEDEDNLVISSKDGLTRIAIGGGTVKITAPTVTIESPAITLDGPVDVTGILTGNAGANLTGTITLTGLGAFPYVITPT